ncbi:hypothetical protein M758_10G183100 [Ceratodon purpureus]|uniref:SOUL heme-binding protein n=1 Tax=Ceratodon purpureus TaxID=3225 RepID=A0A8T0GUA9_CERPU|nr:hypothetical protein KC19_10G187800 [Ceratodon purpureus]KAG0604596.1 hypothetical protein M758_10G183100 [Ceratodon purpureus]
MATMQCPAAAAARIGGLLPIGTSKESSGRARGKRMQVVMRRGSAASSNRLSLVQALSQQAAAQSQRSLQNLVMEVAKYVNPPRSTDANNLEEALMSVPNLESIPYDLVRRAADYEIRDVKSYVVAETTMSGRSGFDFSSSGQAFNTLAAYLFGKNSKRSEMAMTTPVMTNRGQSEGEKMDMTTPVIQQRRAGEGQWRMSFVLPAKYNEDAPLPVDSAVSIRRVPAKTVAVAVFSGFVTDDEVKRREQALRRALLKDPVVRVKADAQPEVAQYNPPFTLPFMRRNEVSLEIENVLSS